MDDIVKQAMTKWPNVPHCYGWLALDARGNWRMRDERSQALGLPGDRINNTTLLGFINRNYLHDKHGRWYFQNGPQRVYVHLEVTPYIAHTDPARGFVLHTGEPLPEIEATWLTETGQLILKSGAKVAALDDRDIAQCLSRLRIAGVTVEDEVLLAWIDSPENAGRMTLDYGQERIPVERIESNAIAKRFGFVQRPEPEGG